MTSAEPTILIVDDTPQNLDILTKMLRAKGYLIRTAISGRIALATALMDPPDIVLLDINMPEMDGIEVCRQFKIDKSLQDIPIVFLTVMSDTAEKVRAFEAGGVDYITKPFELREVESRIKTHLLVREQRRQLVESANAKYYSIFDNAVEGIFQALSDGKVITANTAFLSMLGYTRADEVNLSKNYFLQIGTFEKLKRILKKSGKVERFEAEVCCKNGSRIWVSLKVRSVRDENYNSSIYQGMVENVTDLKNVENEVKEKSARLEEINTALNVLLEKLKESNKNEQETMFTNLRSLVLPYVQALKVITINEKQRHYLNLIEENLSKITSPLIHNLRQFDLTPSEIEIANLIKEGRTTKQIAHILGKSKATIDSHRYKVRKKLGLNSKGASLHLHLSAIEE
ncbi:MAG: response regulator [Syntrophorhabdaceae bacterium]